MSRKSVLLLVVFLIVLSACNLPKTGGVVRGVVYADLNGDGVIDDSEQMSRVAGATVTLTDCGPTQSQLTDAAGNFQFVNLPEGTCHVSVSKGGWEYVGSYPPLGVYPIPVASDPSLPTSFSIYMAPVMDFIPTDTPTPFVTFTPTVVVSSPTPTSSEPMVTPSSVDVNCRFGPGVNYLATGSLRVGEMVPIRATIADRSWWQIEDPRERGAYCWVSASVTTATGDLSRVRVIEPPGGLVIDVTIDPISDVAASCDFPTVYSPRGAITTNGPATVVYHWEIWRDGSYFHGTGDTTLTFSGAATQSIDPGADRGGCGNYVIRLIVTSPNSLSAEEAFTIRAP
jgi:uncharacterized protein YraI